MDYRCRKEARDWYNDYLHLRLCHAPCATPGHLFLAMMSLRHDHSVVVQAAGSCLRRAEDKAHADGECVEVGDALWSSKELKGAFDLLTVLDRD